MIDQPWISRADLPSALLQDGPRTPSQVTSLSKEAKAKVEGEIAECVNTSAISGAGDWRLKENGSRLAQKPVNEMRAGEDEVTDRHIENEDLENRD